MARYDFLCRACGNHFEGVQPWRSRSAKRCPACGKRVARRVPCCAALETDTSLGEEVRRKFRWAGRKVETREELKRARADGIDLVSGGEAERMMAQSHRRREQDWEELCRE